MPLLCEGRVLSKLFRGIPRTIRHIVGALKVFDLAGVKLDTIKGSSEDVIGSSWGSGSRVGTCPLQNSSLGFSYMCSSECE